MAPTRSRARGRAARWAAGAIAGWLALAPSGVALGVELSASTLAISNQDQTAPAAGTLTILGVFDELPPGAVIVSGGAPGVDDVFLIVRGTLTAGAVFSLGGIVTGTGPPQPGGGNFCCISTTGYTAGSERIPGPDEFFPFFWDWFFDDVADPGLWVPGETVELWVGFSQLDPGDEIAFHAIGPSPDPACIPTCPFGSVTVLPPAVPVLGVVGRGALVALLAMSVSLVLARARRP